MERKDIYDAQQENYDKKRKTKKKWIIGISIAVGVIIMAIVGSVLGLSNKEIDGGDTLKISAGKIGDTLKNSDGVEFTLVSVENRKSVGSGLLQENTDENFILLTIKVKNSSNKPISVYGGCVDLYNSDGVKYEEKSNLSIDYIISEDINPGLSKTFQVLYETATKTTEEDYTIKIGYSVYTLDSKRVEFKLK